MDQKQKELIIKKLNYQSNNRGCKETDWILSEFTKKSLNQLEPEDLHNYQFFLAQNDNNIWDWVTNKSAPEDPKLLRILTMIKAQL